MKELSLRPGLTVHWKRQPDDPSERYPEAAKYAKPFSGYRWQGAGQYAPNQVYPKEFEDVVYSCTDLQISLTVE